MRRTIEETRLSGIFFFLSLALLLSGIYMVYDELVIRRPWKAYQARFYEIQVEKFSKDLEEAKRELEADSKKTESYDRAKTQLADLLKNDSDYVKTKNRLAGILEDRRKQLDHAIDAYRLKKADLAEVRYQLDRIFRGEETEERKNELERSFESLREEVEKREEDVLAAQTQLETAEKEFGDWVSEENRLRKEIQSYEKHINLLRERKRAIEDRYLSLTTGEGFEEHFIPRANAIKQLVNEDLGVVDRCTTCHMGIAQTGFEDQPQPYRTHPRLKELLFDRHSSLGCTPCHHGRGRALTVESGHGLEKHWQWPMKQGVFVESSCWSCHSRETNLEGAPNLSRGVQLVQELGCFGCHPMEAYEWKKVGPSLSYTASKTSLAWLTNWIEKPKEVLPKTAMPDFLLDPEQAVAVAHYLIDSSSKMDDLEPVDPSLGDAGHGERLFEQVGCMGCHSLAPKENDDGPSAGPNLSEIGSKAKPEWVYAWLKNPLRFDRFAKMPNLRLSDEEALDLTAFLAGLVSPSSSEAPVSPSTLRAKEELVAEGRKLISRYGCFGCHEINGFEEAARIGADLSAWGDKDIHLLDFGHLDIPKTRESWILQKLKDPRSFEVGRRLRPEERLRMPVFDLSESDRRALAVAVTGFSKEPIPGVRQNLPERYRAQPDPRQTQIEEGRRIVRKYNCTGCHRMEKDANGRIWGGDILVSRRDSADTPPALYGEGRKVQPEWLFNFLLDVREIRPWLTIRMPDFSFTEDEVLKLVRYFSASAGMDRSPYDNLKGKQFDPEVIEAGMQLFHGFQCISCHPVSDEMMEQIPDKTSLAPNLDLTKERLRYNWLHDWILDPEKIQPGTKMPSFFIDGKSYAHLMLEEPRFAEIKAWFDEHYSPETQKELLTDTDWVIGALQDFLWNFDSEAYFERFPWTPPAPAPTSTGEGEEDFENEFE